jgi:hypothetical protein
MNEVTKAQFKKAYFKYGGTDRSSQEYWDEFYEREESIPMKYMLQKPESPEHTRMMIVNDTGAREYRMFFMTEEAEERFFDFPGKD